MKKERILGLDIIRTIAVSLVILIHSYAYRKVLDINLLSVKWLVMTFIHYITYACVPLFMVLSGYLLSKKRLSGKYYISIVPILISYIVISLISTYVVKHSQNEVIVLKDTILSFLNFTVGYSWYVEMYIGLFLLVPFFNIMFDAITSKKGHIVLISSLAFLTFLPNVFTSFKLDVVPDFWAVIYPITYYFIGAYISKYKPKIPKLLNIVLLIVAAAVPTALCTLYSASGQYAWFMLCSFYTLTTAIIAALIFLLFYDTDYRFKPVRFVFKEISVCSFEMYLISYMFDSLFYSKTSFSAELIIICVFVCSYISARLIRLVLVPVSDFICKILGNWIDKGKPEDRTEGKSEEKIYPIELANKN